MLLDVFVDFLFELRRQGVGVGVGEWLAFHRALERGLVRDAQDLYALGRAVLVRTEGHYDAFDVAFAAVFADVAPPELHEALRRWLEDPVLAESLSPEAFSRLAGIDLDELRRRFEEMLERQRRRHDGGSRFIGTGGTSPFGSGGQHPTGIRVGQGGGRSAVQVAQARRFRNYRTDVALDVRQFKAALRELRALAREGDDVLDVDRTVDRTCREGGDIELVFGPDRRNTIELLLLMDAGGSMEPYARLVDRLFTASSGASHWKRFSHYFFHNVVYGRVYTDIERRRGVTTASLLADNLPDTKVIFAGDACMGPWELMASGGVLAWGEENRDTGLQWLQRFARRFASCAWLNPEPQRYWGHPTIDLIGRVIPMFPLTLDGLRAAVRHLRAGREGGARRAGVA